MPWVIIAHGASSSTLQLAPSFLVDAIDYTLTLESYYVNSSVKFVIKTDTITVRVVPTCPITSAEIDNVQDQLTSEPLILETQANKIGFASIGYIDRLDQIREALAYDEAKEAICEIKVELESSHVFLGHDKVGQQVQIESDEATEAAEY